MSLDLGLGDGSTGTTTSSTCARAEMRLDRLHDSTEHSICVAQDKAVGSVLQMQLNCNILQAAHVPK